MAIHEDERGITPIIGVVLLVGIFILLLGVLQVTAVPIWDGDIEYAHYQDAQTDMTQLRADYLDAGGSGTTRSAAVKLGMTYPERVLFLSGPPRRGQLSTTNPGEITLTNTDTDVATICGYDSAVETRSIEFNTDYQYIGDGEAPPYVYENTVLYRDAGDPVFESEQVLIQDNRINLYPLNDSFSKSGIEAASVEFLGAETGVATVQAPFELSMPSRLDATAWNRLIEQSNVVAVDETGDRVRFDVSGGESWTVRCSAIGTDTTPDVTPAEPPEGGEDPEINPASPNDVRVVLSDTYIDNNNIVATFEYLANGTATMTEARVAFYDGGQNQNFPDTVTITQPSQNGITELGVGDNYTDLATAIEVTPSGSVVHFDPNKANPRGDWFVFQTRFASGDRATYFIYAPGNQSGGANGGPTADANGPYTVDEGSSIVLDGTNSSATGSPTYSWNITSGPGSLADADTATPTYTAPTDGDSSNESVTVELVVENNKGNDTDTTTITVIDFGGGTNDDVVSGTASDLSGTNSQSQTFTISLGDDLQSGQDISIDLSDTSGPGGSERISYSTPNTTGPGSVTLNGKTITYSPAGSETSGDTITITATADPQPQADGNLYEVTFTGDDESSATDTFTVNSS